MDFFFKKKKTLTRIGLINNKVIWRTRINTNVI